MQAALDSRLWAALATFNGLAGAVSSAGLVNGSQQQTPILGLQLLQQQSNQLYAFPMAQAQMPPPPQPEPTNSKRQGPPPSSGAARQRKSVMNKKAQMAELQSKVDIYTQQARDMEAANTALRRRQCLLNQLVALASLPLQKPEASPACEDVCACDDKVAADVRAVHDAVERSHKLTTQEFLGVQEAYVRSATVLLSSDNARHASVLACLTTAYRQVVEAWEMHHLQEAYEMRNMNLAARLASSAREFLDQDDSRWADICACTAAREGLLSWARAEVERGRQADLQCIVELCKEGLARRLSGVMVTLLLDLLARRALPARTLAALVVESWPYRSNPVHMFKAPAVVYKAPPPAPPAPVLPPVPSLQPAATLPLLPPPVFAPTSLPASAAATTPSIAAQAPVPAAAPEAAPAEAPLASAAPAAVPLPIQALDVASQPPDPLALAAQLPAVSLALAGRPLVLPPLDAASAVAMAAAAAAVAAGKPKKKGASRDTESLAAQALMMMAGK